MKRELEKRFGIKRERLIELISIAEERNSVCFYPFSGEVLKDGYYIVDITVQKLPEVTAETLEAFCMNYTECFNSTGWYVSIYKSDNDYYLCKTFVSEKIEAVIHTASLLDTRVFSSDYKELLTPYSSSNTTSVQDILYRKEWLENFYKYTKIEL